MSILETIDNAIDDYGTSGDAMRWTAEPPPVRRHPIDEWLETFAEESARLTEWQRQVLDLPTGWRVPENRTIRVFLQFDDTPLRRAIADSRFAIDEVCAFHRLARASNRVRTCYPIRPARISSMRRAYRHKTRNRW